ncbi:L-type lectin-domain containing receptor kinase S.6 [Hibiscus syriacus]|uniref:L-type lectin-domain containing receptor kinase S.6 n=1 Tax=Hibiscus syriacus TaxID=106335 RepID=A0A6A3B7K8_HIBSY|nr:L-type lectin-domain containing receptor kinase S.6 [Hibiscus syriacus]
MSSPSQQLIASPLSSPNASHSILPSTTPSTSSSSPHVSSPSPYSPPLSPLNLSHSNLPSTTPSTSSSSSPLPSPPPPPSPPRLVQNAHPMVTRGKAGCEAVQSEYTALMKNGTWELKPLPPTRKAIGCFKQRSEDGKELVCCLKKALYRLRQAPRAWFETLRKFLVENLNFVASKADSSMFIRNSSCSQVLLMVYVDDIVITGSQVIEVDTVVQAINKKFSLKDLGQLELFLGMQVEHSQRGLFLNQKKYISELLKSIVGGVQYICLTRPDIVYAVNKVSHYMNSPCDTHWRAMKYILRMHLRGSRSLLKAKAVKEEEKMPSTSSAAATATKPVSFTTSMDPANPVGFLEKVFDFIAEESDFPVKMNDSDVSKPIIRIIDIGGSAVVYKGYVLSAETVAVKRFDQFNEKAFTRNLFSTKFAIMTRWLNHCNLVQLQGWYCEESELVLVYEYLSNGSLYQHIHKTSVSSITTLSWILRLKEVLGVASALSSLHEECERQIIHRDVKTCNIMLDDEFNAKLGDFGLAEVYGHCCVSRDATIPARTIGYLAPEYVYTSASTVKTDVYSFGVVVLEVATGKRPVDEN